MDAAITNTTAAPLFIPGPNIELAATGDPNGNDVKTWSDITLGALDSNAVIKEGLVSGDLTVAMTPDALDAAQPDQSGRVGLTDGPMLPSYTVAQLAVITGVNGRMAYASDGRSGVEGAGVGTGVPVVYTNGQWRRPEDMAIVAA